MASLDSAAFMVFSFLKNLLDTNQTELNRYQSLLKRIITVESDAGELSDEEYAQKTIVFKQRIADGERLDAILPEAFALVRAAVKRILGFRLNDVQLLAAMAFHEGKIAEQKTGEGKTLSAVPALYLNALLGKGVHLVTVNDYLARRDAGWNGPIFKLLGVSIGIVVQDNGMRGFLYDPSYEDVNHDDERLRHLKPVPRKEAYLADITYGTNTEFGFDYLRDNMVASKEQQSQRGHHYAIVDEVDSILIDEARTPLIISAPDADPTDKYIQFAQLATRLQAEIDFTVDEKLRNVALTDHGIKKIEKILGVTNLYEKDFDTIHHLENALKAKTLFTRDRHYVVREGEIMIVDEFTGRLMPGRRWSEGLHQAVEAKEGVRIQQESRTLATVSLQNYFRMYEKLAGMTGTAATEAEELRKIYNLEVVVIPTNKNVARTDHNDIIYKTTRAKYTAIANLVDELHKKGQPVLIGTTSIEKNEVISQLLHRKGIPHESLNAKNHEREAAIIAQAGAMGAVTVATNIAGRGVDIVLGGAKPEKPKEQDAKSKKAFEQDMKDWETRHDEVISLGGLYVIGSERHESRRIDNQLRGRSGRQGDPGASQFYVSLDDEIMRLFGGEQVARLMTAFNLPEDQPLEARMVSRAIEQAQVKVEGFHFDQRKYLVEYDDVMNKQREIIYQIRQKTLESYDFHNELIEKSLKQIDRLIDAYAPDGYIPSEVDALGMEIAEIVPMKDDAVVDLKEQIRKASDARDLQEQMHEILRNAFEKKRTQLTDPIMQEVERATYRMTLDQLWMDHLDQVDDLREGIGLRSFAQRDPLVEYKQEAFGLFDRLMNQIDYQVVRRILRSEVTITTNQPTITAATLETKHETPVDLEAAVTQAQDAEIVESIPVEETTAQKHKPELKAGKGDLDMFVAAMSAVPSSSVPSHLGGNGGSEKLGRNDPCWCGSGKKWKKCHINTIPQNGEEKMLFDLYASDQNAWKKEVDRRRGR